MYAEYYGLRDIPFDVNPNPKFLFQSTEHQEGLARMLYGVKMRKGLLVLTGQAGTGKTTLVHSLLQRLGDETISAWVFNTTLQSDDLLRYICRDFGVERSTGNKAELLLEMYHFLIKNYEMKRNALLIVDEAQNLCPKTLEEIRLLTNLETSQTKLVQIILAGQPPLEDMLRLPELCQFRQRVTIRYKLKALARDQVGEYIIHRLKVAGAEKPGIFTIRAIDEIYRCSGGIPRLINAICDNALLHGFVLNMRKIDGNLIRQLEEEGSFLEPAKQQEKDEETPVTTIKHMVSPFASIDMRMLHTI